MDETYTFEPSDMEVLLTEFIGNSLIRRFYSGFVNKLGIGANDKVLDYCCGSGIISRKILKSLNRGMLVYADVSCKWLRHAAKNLGSYKLAESCSISEFGSMIAGGEYNKIVVHYVLHDFPEQYRIQVINQLVKNMKRDGILFIREPLGEKHGMKFYELVNLLEATKSLTYEYVISKKFIIGEFVDIKCRLS